MTWIGEPDETKRLKIVGRVFESADTEFDYGCDRIEELMDQWNLVEVTAERMETE